MSERQDYAAAYGRAMAAADERFAPLVAELKSRGVESLGVDQTGGMVMCLHIPIPVGQERGDYPYLYVGDYGQAGASLHVADESGLSLSPDASLLPIDMDGWSEDAPEDDGWTPENAAKQADWLAPLVPLLADWWRENVVIERRHRTIDTRGVIGAPDETPVIDTDARWRDDPILPRTDVSRY